MVSGVVTLIIFLFALGGMIFLHELGHFIAARWAGIEVEEFGFGFPPRAFGFWRGKGFLLFNHQRLEIPENFDLGFDWQSVLHQPSTVTLDRQGEKYILRTLEFEAEEKPAPSSKIDHVTVDANGKVVDSLPQAASKKNSIRVGKASGAIEWKGEVNETHVGTLFSINWLPLGGFVRPKGENDPNVSGGLASANPWKRLVVLFAGPTMNLLTAIVVFSFLISFAGVPVPGSIKIESVAENSPAQQANIQAGDILLAINNQKVTDATPAIAIIKENLDKPVELLIERNGRQITLTATPLSTRKASEGALGVGLGYPTRPATFVESISGGFIVTGLQAASIVYLPIALIQGAIAPADARLVGFKGIFDMFGMAVKEDVSSRQEVAAAPAGASPPQPTNWTLNLIGMLSISLGVINLFPIPALDGGRILFTLPEILFHKRIPPQWENTVNGIAMLLLIGLMLFVNVMDFINPAKIPLP
jgi:regulator of sigma E protease